MKEFKSYLAFFQLLFQFYSFVFGDNPTLSDHHAFSSDLTERQHCGTFPRLRPRYLFRRTIDFDKVGIDPFNALNSLSGAAQVVIQILVQAYTMRFSGHCPIEIVVKIGQRPLVGRETQRSRAPEFVVYQASLPKDIETHNIVTHVPYNLLASNPKPKQLRSITHFHLHRSLIKARRLIKL